MKLSSRDHKHTFCLISTSTGSEHTQAKTNIVDKCRKTSCCETKSYYNLSNNIVIFIKISFSKYMILIHAGALIRLSVTDKQHIGLFKHLTM